MVWVVRSQVRYVGEVTGEGMRAVRSIPTLASHHHRCCPKLPGRDGVGEGMYLIHSEHTHGRGLVEDGSQPSDGSVGEHLCRTSINVSRAQKTLAPLTLPLKVRAVMQLQQRC